MLFKLVLAGLLRLSILTAVFLGSCVGSGVMYMHSPNWKLNEVDLEKDRKFFGAYTKENSDEVEVVLYKYLPEPGDERINYRLPREEISYAWDGGGSASITASDQADGSQLVRIHAIGDTPWASLSEYRVTNNEINPLRYGASNHFFLLGVLLSPFITWILQKPVRRAVAAMVGISEKPSGSKQKIC